MDQKQEPWLSRPECERADIPMNVTFREREQQFAGGNARAARADMIVRLHPDGTYCILKNRKANRASPFTYQTCVVYATGEDIVPFGDGQAGKQVHARYAGRDGEISYAD